VSLSFSKKKKNSNNCHDHVASALNGLGFRRRSNWGSVSLALFMVAHGKFVSGKRFASTYIPFLICMLIFVLPLAIVYGLRA
jgi:hypothetical protein